MAGYVAMETVPLLRRRGLGRREQRMEGSGWGMEGSGCLNQ